MASHPYAHTLPGFPNDPGLRKDHRLPSTFAVSISSAVMKRVIFDLISSTTAFACSHLFPTSSPTPGIDASSAITSWFKLRRFLFARSFSIKCRSSGKFRIVNVAMPAF